MTGDPNTLFVFGHHRHAEVAGWRGRMQHPRDHTLFAWVPAEGGDKLRGIPVHRIIVAESVRMMNTQSEWSEYHKMLSLFPLAMVIRL